jgi:hypothetical protein
MRSCFCGQISELCGVLTVLISTALQCCRLLFTGPKHSTAVVALLMLRKVVKVSLLSECMSVDVAQTACQTKLQQLNIPLIASLS